MQVYLAGNPPPTNKPDLPILGLNVTEALRGKTNAMRYDMMIYLNGDENVQISSTPPPPCNRSPAAVLKLVELDQPNLPFNRSATIGFLMGAGGSGYMAQFFTGLMLKFKNAEAVWEEPRFASKSLVEEFYPKYGFLPPFSVYAWDPQQQLLCVPSFHVWADRLKHCINHCPYKCLAKQYRKEGTYPRIYQQATPASFSASVDRVRPRTSRLFYLCLSFP